MSDRLGEKTREACLVVERARARDSLQAGIKSGCRNTTK